MYGLRSALCSCYNGISRDFFGTGFCRCDSHWSLDTTKETSGRWLTVDNYPSLEYLDRLEYSFLRLRSRHAVVRIFSIEAFLLSLFMIMFCHRIPPEDGHADVSFWYATYCVVGIAILLVSFTSTFITVLLCILCC